MHHETLIETCRASIPKMEVSSLSFGFYISAASRNSPGSTKMLGLRCGLKCLQGKSVWYRRCFKTLRQMLQILVAGTSPCSDASSEAQVQTQAGSRTQHATERLKASHQTFNFLSCKVTSFTRITLKVTKTQSRHVISYWERLKTLKPLNYHESRAKRTEGQRKTCRFGCICPKYRAFAVTLPPSMQQLKCHTHIRTKVCRVQRYRNFLEPKPSCCQPVL